VTAVYDLVGSAPDNSRKGNERCQFDSVSHRRKRVRVQLPSGSRTRRRFRRPSSFMGVEPTVPAYLWEPPTAYETYLVAR